MTNDELKLFYENRYPIGELFDELFTFINMNELEDNTKILKQELLDLVLSGKAISNKIDMIPRYDVLLTIINFVRIRVDFSLLCYSKENLGKLYLWHIKRYDIIQLYDYKGVT